MNTVWDWNNPQIHSLDGGETLVVASQVLERSEKDSKNKGREQETFTGQGMFGACQERKEEEKKITADQSLISHNPPQKCPGPSNICLFPLPVIPAIACLGDLLENVLDNSRSFTVRSMKIEDRYYYPLSNTPTVSTVLQRDLPDNGF